MKSKTLSAMAVAAAVGLSASAFAGSTHEVMTPMSPNESGSSLAVLEHSLSSSHHQMSASLSPHSSSVDSFSGNVGGLELSEATDWSASYDQMAEASDYSFSPDAYMVSWTPISIDGLDYYLIDMEPISFISAEELAFFTDEGALGLSTGDEVAFTQEDAVATTLAQAPIEDTAEVG
jgi:hypothetical protein